MTNRVSVPVWLTVWTMLAWYLVFFWCFLPFFWLELSPAVGLDGLEKQPQYPSLCPTRLHDLQRWLLYVHSLTKCICPHCQQGVFGDLASGLNEGLGASLGLFFSLTA